jgi:predicted RNA-binding Zn ribbon-like protein
MMSSMSEQRFRQGAGRLSLDFIRTLRWHATPAASEELTDAAALAAWVDQCAPCETTGGAEEEIDVAAARRLREAVHALVAAARTGTELPAEARGLVNAAAAGTVPAPRLDGPAGLRWYADRPVAATMALVARDALDLVCSPAIDRVRPCADPTCRALFYDGSRPGARRWCSMDVCGNRAKKGRQAAHGG